MMTREEKNYLATYDVSKYERPSVTVDMVIFTIDQDNDLNILLIQRGDFPYKGRWALPGGFLNVGKESLDEAAARELKEETGVDQVFLSQLYTFGQIDRDPRTTVISVAYTALVPKQKLSITAGDDAKDAKLFKIRFDVDGILFTNGQEVVTQKDLAFDHAKIIKTAITRLRGRVDYEMDAFELLQSKEEFTISELRKIYEAIKNRPLDVPNFRKMFLRNYIDTGKAVSCCQVTTEGRGKPAMLYRLKGENE